MISWCLQGGKESCQGAKAFKAAGRGEEEESGEGRGCAGAAGNRHSDFPDPRPHG